jgi:hypothetical protein
MRRLNISQEELAARIRDDGRDTCGCNRAMVDRWLRGVTRRPQPRYLRALERVTGMPVGSLGFAGAADDGLAPGGVTADAAAMEGFRQADLRAGGSHMYGTVRDYLCTEVAPRLVTPGGREIFTAAGALTEMTGWMSHDAGRDQAAREHFARALDLARTGGDRQVIAHILASAGHIADHLGDPDEAIRSAQAGLGALLPGNPSLRSYLLAVQARGFAGLREHAEAIRCLSLAETALQGARAEPASPWINAFDEASLASEAARCMRALGDLGEARRQAERFLRCVPPPGRAAGHSACSPRRACWRLAGSRTRRPRWRSRSSPRRTASAHIWSSGT